jgi:hypothetical protein
MDMQTEETDKTKAIYLVTLSQPVAHQLMSFLFLFFFAKSFLA